MGLFSSRPSASELEGVHVVVLGCGYAGFTMAVQLKRAGVKFSLVEEKQYFHHCVGALRAAVNPDYAVKTAIPLEEAFGSSYVQGKVVSLSMEGKVVVLEGGREIPFTHCVIAVGSLGPHPARTKAITIQELLEESKEYSEMLMKANDVVVIGGGAVGVEMIGEIYDRYKSKNLTLVSSSKKLCSPDFTDTFYNTINGLLESAEIKIVYGRADNLKDLELNKIFKQTVKVGGEEIAADLVISCVGLPSNKESVCALVPKESIDENGRIKVNEFLQLPGNANIYALGDCCNTQENKMAAYAMKHAELVVANLLREVRGKTPSPYQTPFVGMLVPFGKYQGAAIFNGFHMPNFIARKFKYEDLFTSRNWSDAGLKIPS